ncbi:MAG TPA: transporter substrate-binding domain-containing protein [Rheinheimera sp.]|nr:transporter substrate-binding domain-containing protein [Rheinheimera sp.]
MWNKLWLMPLLLALPLAGAETFKVAIYYPQVPPYMYSANDNVPLGVVPELLNDFFNQQPYQLQYVYENRQRAELGVYAGKYDATVLAEKWTEDPQALLFSQPIVEHRDYLYSLQPMPDQPLSELSGRSICLRRYYKYTAFTEELASGQLIRLDSDSEFDQFNMLVNGRCDLAYMNEHVATWLINHHFPATQFYHNDVAADQAELTLALHPKWAALKKRLDAYIREAHRNGLIDRILARHMKKKPL